MDNSLDNVKVSIFRTFRICTFIIFLAILLYSPIVLFLVNYSLLKTPKLFFIEGISMFGNIAASFIAIILINYIPKINVNIDYKINILAYFYLFGMTMITISSYPKNPVAFVFIVIALIPIVLVHNKLSYILYNLIVICVTFWADFISSSQIRTSEGIMEIQSLALTPKMSMIFFLILGLCVSYFIRKSIIEIFKNLAISIKNANNLACKFKDSETKTRAIFDLSFGFIGLLDSNGTLIEANQTALNFIGTKKEDVLGKLFWDTPWWNFSTEIQNKIKASIELAKNGEVIRYETRSISEKGDICDIDFILKPVFDENNNVIFIIPEGHDITKRKAVENELLQLNKSLEVNVELRTKELSDANKSLEKTNDELKEEIEERIKLEKELKIAKINAEEASKHKSQFVANMSHELRTPLNVIIGFNHLLEQTNLYENQKDYLNKSTISANNLLGIVNNILDFSKIEANKMVLEKIPFNISTIFDNLKSMMINNALEKGLKLEFTIENNIPVTLIGDPTRLSQCIINIINNAIKFTKAGEILVCAKVIEKNLNSIIIKFNVEDTGIGMTDEQLSNIFNPFIQADSSTTREFGGTGLGLSICKQLVELMEGVIYVESVINKGSKFTIEIPFEYSDINLVDVKRENIDAKKLIGKKILVVEDNEMNQIIFKEILYKKGVIVDLAWNGIDAINKFENGNIYDLILMDIRMPILNGYDTTKKIREFGIKTPILAITADVSKETFEEISSSGMNGYLLKPIEPAKMIICIEKFINDSIKAESLSINDINESILSKNIDNQLLVLDFNLGLMRIDGEMGSYIKILLIFKERYLNKSLKDQIINQDLEMKIRYFHTLKGISASIGALKVAKESEIIQEKLEKNIDIKDEVIILEEYLLEVLNLLDKFIEKHNKNAENKPIQVNNDFKKSVQIFRKLISENDIDSINFYKSIEVNFIELYGESWNEEIKYYLNNFMWKEISVILDSVIN